MRTLPAGFTAEMQAIFTQSTWLIRMITSGSPPVTLNLSSSSGAVTWDATNWLAVGLKVEGSVTENELKFSLPNESGQILSLAAGGDLKRAVVDVFIMYPGASDAVQFMQGFVSSVNGLMTNRATFAVDRFADENVVVPSIQISPPGWTKLPPLDLELEWAGKIINLGE